MTRVCILLAIAASLALAGAGHAQDGGGASVPAEAPAAVPESETETETETEAEAEAESESEAERPEDRAFEVTYHDAPSPLVFTEPAHGKSARERAAEATAALKGALDKKRDEAPPPPSVTVDGGRATVRVAGQVIAVMTERDADVAGLTLDEYAEQLEDRLEAYVPEQMQRKTLQLFFLHLFLSVLFGVIGFVTLRGLRRSFDRWEGDLEERRGSFKPISVLRVPIISGDALGGALAFGLATGRVLAYLVATVATLSAMLSQFEATRPLLKQLASWSLGPLVRGAETVVTAVPGIVLVVVIGVALQGGMRVINLLLDGVAAKRIKWKRLPPERVPVFRLALRALLIVIVAPLMVALIFGRFGTPLETLALSVGIAVTVATIPLLATTVVGVFVLWRGSIKAGDWVHVGDVSGEVTSCTVQEVSLVPEDGGTITVPMVYLLLHPLRRLRQAPTIRLDVELVKDRPAKELLEIVADAIHATEPDARAELRDVAANRLLIRLYAPSVREGVRQQLLIALSDAADRNELTLPERTARK